jgi:hypothetical protein
MTKISTLSRDNGTKTAKPITRKQQLAVTALLQAATVEAAAMRAGVSPRTVYRWQSESPAFGEAVKKAQDAATTNAGARLAGGLDAMLSVLWDVAIDKTLGPTVRVRAANHWIQHHKQYAELSDIIDRVTAIENRVQVEYVNDWRAVR